MEEVSIPEHSIAVVLKLSGSLRTAISAHGSREMAATQVQQLRHFWEHNGLRSWNWKWVAIFFHFWLMGSLQRSPQGSPNLQDSGAACRKSPQTHWVPRSNAIIVIALLPFPQSCPLKRKQQGSSGWGITTPYWRENMDKNSKRVTANCHSLRTVLRTIGSPHLLSQWLEMKWGGRRHFQGLC